MTSRRGPPTIKHGVRIVRTPGTPASKPTRDPRRPRINVPIPKIPPVTNSHRGINKKCIIFLPSRATPSRNPPLQKLFPVADPTSGQTHRNAFEPKNSQLDDASTANKQQVAADTQKTTNTETWKDKKKDPRISHKSLNTGSDDIVHYKVNKILENTYLLKPQHLTSLTNKLELIKYLHPIIPKQTLSTPKSDSSNLIHSGPTVPGSNRIHPDSSTSIPEHVDDAETATRRKAAAATSNNRIHPDLPFLQPRVHRRHRDRDTTQSARTESSSTTVAEASNNGAAHKPVDTAHAGSHNNTPPNGSATAVHQTAQPSTCKKSEVRNKNSRRQSSVVLQIKQQSKYKHKNDLLINLTFTFPLSQQYRAPQIPDGGVNSARSRFVPPAGSNKPICIFKL